MDYAQSLFEAISESAVILDKAGRILDWNQSASTLFGYSKREVLGRSINLVYDRNYPFPKIIKETLPFHKKWLAETVFFRKNGTKGTCRTSATLLTNPAQGKTAALLIHQNISAFKVVENDLKATAESLGANYRQSVAGLLALYPLYTKNSTFREQLERDLRESELRFRLLAENATDIIARVAADGTYLYVSPSCRTLLGYKPEELIGKSAFKYTHHDDVTKLKKALFNSRHRETKSNTTVIYRARRKEGEYRWFETLVRLICDEDTREIREIQTASRDVTDHVLDKKVGMRKQQLAHVFRLSTMEEMASGMAHEISQPLSAIINYTRGCVRHLQSGQHDAPLLTEVMEKAVTQAERAGEVIQRLKNFFCKGQLVKTPCKINSILRETVSLIRHDFTSTKTKVDLAFEKDLPFISADRIQLQQVMLNLLQNAIDAMRDINPGARRIKIETATLNKDTVAITVNDSGPGFSKEVVHKVFKPFFSTKAHGRGMGLAICRSIIEAHGGVFTINPNTSNNSWIRFTLPIE